MKRMIAFVLVFILNFQIVYSLEGSSSASVKDAIGGILTEFTSGDKLFYIYNEADEGAFLSVYFGLFSNNLNKYNLYIEGKNFIKSSNEHISKNDLSSRNVVIFGGPCANKYWAEFSSETCEEWPYKPGQSIVKVVDNNGHFALLIAGTDKKDTFEIARLILQYNTNDNLNKNSFYLHSSSSKRVTHVDKCLQETRDFTCFRYYYNAKFVYRKNNYDYVITVKDINDADNIITFVLNGKPYSLELGEPISENNIEITPNRIWYSPITSEPESVEFHFDESMEGFEPLSIKPFIEKEQKCIGLKLNERNLVYFPNERIPYDVKLKKTGTDNVDIAIDENVYAEISEGIVIDNIRGRPIRIGDFFKSLGSTDIESATLCFENVKPECTLDTPMLVPINLESKYNVEIKSKDICESTYNANKLDLDKEICNRLLTDPVKKVFLRWDFRTLNEYNLDCSKT